MNVAILLAPVISVHNSPIKTAQFLSKKNIRTIVEKNINRFHYYNLFPYDAMHNKKVNTICNLPIIDGLCKEYITKTVFNKDIDNIERESMVASNIPAGAGWKTFIHYSQLIACKSNCFKRFDYETPEANMKVYNQTTPPDYNISAISVKVAHFTGDVDVECDPKDAAWSIKQFNQENVIFN